MNLKKIIEKHFLNLKNINNLQKETIEKFDINKYLIKNKFDQNKNNTHMEKKDFYENLISNNFTTKNINFYLTNGTNKNLSDGGSGTNKSITDINKKFFMLDNENNIFCPNMSDIPIISKEKYNNLLIVNEKIDCKNPGAVFYKEIENNKYKNYNIIGVYHIYGWNLQGNNIEDLASYKKLVSLYYIAILDHFFKKIYNTQNFSILHLVQSPGFWFIGTEKTTKIFINTICGYLFLKKEELDYSPENFKISLDYDGDFNINNEDIKYLSDIINEYEKK